MYIHILEKRENQKRQTLPFKVKFISTATSPFFMEATFS